MKPVGARAPSQAVSVAQLRQGQHVQAPESAAESASLHTPSVALQGTQPTSWDQHRCVPMAPDA
eukprot:4653599-Pleurochrysis_carterae.AAC.1